MFLVETGEGRMVTICNQLWQSACESWVDNTGCSARIRCVTADDHLAPANHRCTCQSGSRRKG